MMKKGDKVIRTKPTIKNYKIEKGEMYTVEDVRDYNGDILLKGNNQWFHPSNFEIYVGSNHDILLVLREQEIEIEALREKIVSYAALNREMHKKVSGYLDGEDWKHWQKFNHSRFKI